MLHVVARKVLLSVQCNLALNLQLSDVRNCMTCAGDWPEAGAPHKTRSGRTFMSPKPSGGQ